MIRKRCPSCGALRPNHGLKRGKSEHARSLDEQRVAVVAYREHWRERWRMLFGR